MMVVLVKFLLNSPVRVTLFVSSVNVEAAVYVRYFSVPERKKPHVLTIAERIETRKTV